MYNNKLYIVQTIYVFYKYENNICRRKFIVEDDEGKCTFVNDV